MLLLLGLLRVAIVQNFMFMVGFEAVQDLGFFPSVWTSLSPHRQWLAPLLRGEVAWSIRRAREGLTTWVFGKKGDLY